MAEQIVFYVIAALTCVTSLMVVTRKSPISSAVFLVATLFLVAACFALMGADFLAAIQVLVYAGAIMVLFLFVIMLLNVETKELKEPALPFLDKFVLALTVLGFMAIGLYLFARPPAAPQGNLTAEAIAQAGGNTHMVGMKLFSTYLWPFELASFLILLAIVASVLIAKKRAADKPDGSR